MRKLKESGIPFVGKIPSNWRVLKNKRCFQLEKNIVGEQCDKMKLLSLTKKGIIYKDINNTFGKIPESYETYQKVKSGQLVMCLFDLDISSVFSGVSNLEGMISPAYKVYNCNYLINNRYAGYWFDFCFDGRKYMSYSKSLRYVVNIEDFNNIEIIVPPVEIQEVIANFLDKEVSEIDNVINRTKETIEDYKKLKQSIISKIIKEGLSKDISFITLKLKNVSSIIRGASPRPIEKYLTNSQDGVNWIKIGDTVKGSKYITGTTQKILKEGVKNSRYLLPGDLILTNSMSYGEPYILDIDGCIHDGWVAFTNFKGIEKEYLYYFLVADFCKAQFNEQVAGGVVQNLNVEKISKTILHLPSIEEQKKIIEYLDLKCNEIDKLIENKEKIIEELEQYKKSVIYEYVTGKKEVK